MKNPNDKTLSEPKEDDECEFRCPSSGIDDIIDWTKKVTNQNLVVCKMVDGELKWSQDQVCWSASIFNNI